MELIKIKSKKGLNSFVNFPIKLYEEEPNYVPNLNISVKNMLTKANPFFEHSEIALFIVKSGNEIVGRIAAIYNVRHLEVYNDKTGFFGFFDVINNFSAAKMLFDAAVTWLKNKGIDRVIGPTNLTTNDPSGILYKGFKSSPLVQMPYNFSYYNDLSVQYGFSKAIDLYSYKVVGEKVLGSYNNIISRVRSKVERKGITFRRVSSARFFEDMEKLRQVYNSCNASNWGFLPLNEKEFKEMAKNLKMITPLNLAQLVEKDGEVIGFVVAVPDVNELFKRIEKGRLFPFGWLKLLWYKRSISGARVMIVGVLKEFAGQGIDLILYHKISEELGKLNIPEGEAGYVLESNKKMNTILRKIGGKRIKEYRLYQKMI